MKRVIFCVLVISIGLLLKSCNTTEPPPPPDGDEPTLELTLEDVSCIEAWLKLTTTNLQLPTTIELKQFNPTGDSLSQYFILNTQDSLLYVDSLLPNQTYNFHTTIQSAPGGGQASSHTSNELSVTTMDTTSHNFTFETYTFGGTAGSSTLYDVAIINENNIWAVGEIFVADTSQNGYTMYNAVHWDGIQWELMQIPFLFQGDSFYNPIYSVFAFSADDIWFGIGNLIHWDGVNYLPINIATLFPSLVNKIWGSSSSNLYVVGNNGNVIHRNGIAWQRIESGTELNIGDIWGISDGGSGYHKYLVTENALLKLDASNQLSSINVEPGMFLNSVWAITHKLIYTAGDGVVLYKNYNWYIIDLQGVNTVYRVRGQNFNEISGIGSPGSIIYHFNGFSWHFTNPNPSNRFWRIETKNNIIVASGYQGEKAAITILRRN